VNSPARRASRLLVMAWDGMRPDLISPQLTPNLAALAADGVRFENSHAVVPTVTRCNAGTLASGAPPAVHGLPANMLYAPRVDPVNLISFGEGDSFERLRAAYGVFAAPTIADQIADAGGRTVVVSSGTRGCAQMLNPRRREHGELVVHPTLSTDAELAPFTERLGPLPDANVPDTARNAWLAHAVAEIVIPQQRPDAIFFWHDDPDKSQHKFGFGHPLALDAIRSADRHLGVVLAGLDAAGLRDETIVVVVSDHGYVNIRRRVDLGAALTSLDLGADVIIAPNGCAAMIFANGADHRTLADVVQRTQARPEVGVMFSGGPEKPVLDGTSNLAAIGGGGPLAPDILVTSAWSDDLSEHGQPGLAYEFGAPIAGSHGGASTWEIRNTMILAGPGIQKGLRSDVPSGSLDLAPTVLASLGLPRADTMTGRVLVEAFVGAPAGDVPLAAATVVSTDQLSTTVGTTWLRWSAIAGRRYLDSAWAQRNPA
jgi:phosphonoacetate hydrolase